MPIPTYKDWMSRTKRGLLTPRSTELGRLDKALEVYDKTKSEADKQTLTARLDDWIKTKGDGWKQSTRNQDHVVEELYAALHPYRAAAPKWTAPPLPASPTAGEVYLGQSFEYSNSLARAEVPQAFKRAKLLIDATYRGICQARTGGTNRTIYTTWFGAFDQNRFATVFNNVKALYDALFLKPIVLYYRGDGVQGASDCPAETGTMSPGGYFGAAWPPRVLPPSLDRRFTYVFLGRAFFTSGVYAQDSSGGVIIHELSHAICGTDDVVYKGAQTYGPDLCKRLANEKPDLAVHNADSYEYLAENYQSTLFQPKAAALHLPPKASIALNLTPP